MKKAQTRNNIHLTLSYGKKKNTMSLMSCSEFFLCFENIRLFIHALSMTLFHLGS